VTIFLFAALAPWPVFLQKAVAGLKKDRKEKGVTPVSSVPQAPT